MASKPAGPRGQGILAWAHVRAASDGAAPNGGRALNREPGAILRQARHPADRRAIADDLD